MNHLVTGFLSPQEAEAQATQIVMPYIGQLSPDDAETLIAKTAANLRHVSWLADQRGLDHITLGGPRENDNNKGN